MQRFVTSDISAEKPTAVKNLRLVAMLVTYYKWHQTAVTTPGCVRRQNLTFYDLGNSTIYLTRVRKIFLSHLV